MPARRGLMQRLLYNLATILLLPWALLHLVWRARRQPQYLRHWPERFGRYPAATHPPAGKTIWLHAVSVGETRAAEPLVALLKRRYPEHRILITHMTPTGRQTSASIFGDGVARAYLPYDYPGCVERFLDHFRPAVGAIMETELWPNLVAACRRRNIPLLLVNARLSERSARRYARLPGLAAETLRALAAIGAQAERDAARLTELGAQDVAITGNMKFDIAPPENLLALGTRWREEWGERPVLLAASTRAGEEALLLEALRARPIKDLLLVLVPRHPQRFETVGELARALGMKVQRRSERSTVAADTSVMIGDSMGEMFAYYAACDVAFIGGSLLQYGSQNLIEACAAGAPVLIGPSTFNFAAAAEGAMACGAARQVRDAGQLVQAAEALLHDPAARTAMARAGREFAARHRGASMRTLALLERCLEGAGGSPADH